MSVPRPFGATSPAPGGPNGSDPVPAQLDDELRALVEDLREVVIEDRMDEARRREAGGRPPMSPQDHHLLAERSIRSELRSRFHSQTHSGVGALTNEQESLVRDRVLASVFSRLPELDALLARRDLTDVFFNGPRDVRIHKLDGTEERVPSVFVDDEDMVRFVRVVARAGGHLATGDDPFAAADDGSALEHEFSPTRPTVDLRLMPSGARFTAVGPWVTLNGTHIAIRLHSLIESTQQQLVEWGMYDAGTASFLAAAMRLGWGIFIAGAPGAGKTTLMRALAHELDPSLRIIQIEQNPELGLESSRFHNHVWAWVERPPNMEGRGAVTLGDHARNAQRAKPGRIIIGEVRGGEVMALLSALSLGVPGMCTMHATSAHNVLSRLVLYAQEDNPTLAEGYVLRAAAEGLHLIVHLTQVPPVSGVRRISEILHVEGFDEAAKRPITNEWFVPDDSGAATRNPNAPIPQPLLGHLMDAGYRPELHPRRQGGGW